MVVNLRAGRMEQHQMIIVSLLTRIARGLLGKHRQKEGQAGASLLKTARRATKIVSRMDVSHVPAVLMCVPVTMVSQWQDPLVRVANITVLRAIKVIPWTETCVIYAKQANSLPNLTLLAKIVVPADTQQRVQGPATGTSILILNTVCKICTSTGLL